MTGASGKLKCDYCGSLYEVAEIEALYKDKDAAAAAASAKAEEKTADGDWEYSDNGWGEDAAHMRSYNCPSCGAELICDDTTAATSLPLLRQSQHCPRPVHRYAQAGLCHSLQAR